MSNRPTSARRSPRNLRQNHKGNRLACRLYPRRTTRNMGMDRTRAAATSAEPYNRCWGVRLRVRISDERGLCVEFFSADCTDAEDDAGGHCQSDDGLGGLFDGKPSLSEPLCGAASKFASVLLESASGCVKPCGPFVDIAALAASADGTTTYRPPYVQICSIRRRTAWHSAACDYDNITDI